MICRFRSPSILQRIDDVVENAHRKRVGLLKDHAHPLAQLDHIDALGIDRVAVDPHVAAGRDAVDQVVHPVDAPQQRRFAAARRADDRRHLALGDRHRDVEQGLLVAVPEREVFDLQDRLLRHRPSCGSTASIGSPRAIASSRLMPLASADSVGGARDWRLPLSPAARCAMVGHAQQCCGLRCHRKPCAASRARRKSVKNSAKASRAVVARPVLRSAILHPDLAISDTLNPLIQDSAMNLHHLPPPVSRRLRRPGRRRCLAAAGSRAQDSKEPLVQDLAGPVVAAQDALRQASSTTSTSPRRPRRTTASTPSSTSTSSSRTRPRTTAYLAELKKRADDLGVKTLLIMCDGEGRPRRPRRRRSGPRPSRTTTSGSRRPSTSAATRSASTPRSTASSRSRSSRSWPPTACGGCREFAATHGLNVIVENHGGLSSNGEWLAGVMKLVDHKNCGTLPDFGNFRSRRRQGIRPLQGRRRADAVRQGRQRQEPRLRRRGQRDAHRLPQDDGDRRQTPATTATRHRVRRRQAQRAGRHQGDEEAAGAGAGKDGRASSWTDMFHPHGPTFWELAEQCLSSTERGYDLLAPKFDFTPFRTPDEILDGLAKRLGRRGRSTRPWTSAAAPGRRFASCGRCCRRAVVGIDFSQGMLDVAAAAVPPARRTWCSAGGTYQSSSSAATCWRCSSARSSTWRSRSVRWDTSCRRTSRGLSSGFSGPQARRPVCLRHGHHAAVVFAAGSALAGFQRGDARAQRHPAAARS